MAEMIDDFDEEDIVTGGDIRILLFDNCKYELVLYPPGWEETFEGPYSCTLNQCFEEYINEMEQDDGGDYAEGFARFLRDAADKIEAAGVRARHNHHVWNLRRTRDRKRSFMAGKL